MNEVLTGVMERTAPRFSKNIMEGTSKQLLETAPDYVSDVFTDALKSLSPGIQLTYEGHRRLSPDEEFKYITTGKVTGNTFDLAGNDVYPEEFVFNYMGTKFIRYLYLPFCRRGNLIKFSGIMYKVQQVLSDTVITPSFDQLFVRLFKRKLTFKIQTRNFVCNDEKIMSEIVHGDIMKLYDEKVPDNIGKAIPAIALYPLGKYGIAETLRKYCGVSEVHIETGDVSRYDKERYLVYGSTKVRPMRLKAFNYIGTDIKIIISKDGHSPGIAEKIVLGAIYALEVLPEHTDEIVETYRNDDLEDEQLFWQVLLGRISYKNGYTIVRILDDTQAHFESIEGYMDKHTISKLGELGIVVDNFYDLLVFIIDKYAMLSTNSKEYNADINNRYLDIMYYLLHDLLIGFNRIILAANKRATKKELSLKEVVKLFQKELSPVKILGLTRSADFNLAIGSCDYSGDIMYPKITSSLEDQSRGNGVKRAKKGVMPEGTKLLRGPDLGFGTMLFLPKGLPTCRSRANAYLNFDIHSGRIKYTDKMKDDLEKISKDLQGI